MMKPAIEVMQALVRSFKEVEAAESHLVGCKRDLEASKAEALRIFELNEWPDRVLVGPNLYIRLVRHADKLEFDLVVESDSGVVHASDLKPLFEEKHPRFGLARFKGCKGWLLSKHATAQLPEFTSNFDNARSWPTRAQASASGLMLGMDSYDVVDLDNREVVYRYPEDAGRA